MKMATVPKLLRVVFMFCFFCSVDAAQSTDREEIKRFEISGQFTFLNRVDANPALVVIQRAFPPPSGIHIGHPTIAEFGFGPRVTFNFSKSVAIEAEANVFPVDKTADPMIGVQIRVTEPGGRKLQVVFGPKFGHRWTVWCIWKASAWFHSS